jgi:hypothetical protein
MPTDTPSIPETRKAVICRCPNCGKEHPKVMYWTGKGVPRKFCRLCKLSKSEILYEPANNPGGEETEMRFSELEPV